MTLSVPTLHSEVSVGGQRRVAPGKGPVHLFGRLALGRAGREGEGQVVELSEELGFPGEVRRRAHDARRVGGERADLLAAHAGRRLELVRRLGAELAECDRLYVIGADLFPLRRRVPAW